MDGAAAFGVMVLTGNIIQVGTFAIISIPLL